MKKYCLYPIVNKLLALKFSLAKLFLHPFYTFLLVAFSSFMVSCEQEPNQLGNGVFPDSDFFNLKVDSSFQLTFSTVLTDSVLTHNYLGLNANYYPVLQDSSSLVGEYYDNVFGLVNAGVTFRFYPPDPYTTKIDKWTPVSCKLKLRYDTIGIIGSDFSSLQFGLYKADTTINKVRTFDYTKPYYSSFDPKPYLSPELVIEQPFKSKDTLIFLIKDVEFMKFLMLIDSGQRSTYKKFYKTLNGMHLSAKSKIPQVGGVISLDMLKNGSQIVLNCKNAGKDTSIVYHISPYLGGISSFRHDFSNTEVSNNSNYVYLNGMAGSKGLINFSDLKRWKKSIPGNVSINRAELFLTYDSVYLKSVNIPKSQFPEYLSLMIKNNSITDSQFTYFDGKRDKNKKGEYYFNITNYIQNIIKDGNIDKDNSLLLRVANGAHSAQRTAFNKNVPVKLKITYSIN